MAIHGPPSKDFALRDIALREGKGAMFHLRCALAALAAGDGPLAVEAIEACEHLLMHARLALMVHPDPCAECGWMRPP